MTASPSTEHPTEYSPAEASQRTGMTLDTLRYYERVGLLAPVRRTAGGRRVYTDGEIAWLGLIACLRRAGLGIADLQQFTGLLRAGAAAPGGPVALLAAHRERLVDHIDRMRAALDVLDEKIAYYRRAETG